MSKENKAQMAVGCFGIIFGLVVALPMWVFVMRSILVRGNATDFEWFVFYAYIVTHIACALMTCGLKAMLADE